MWARLPNAPWWVYSLVFGVPFGVLRAVPAFGAAGWSLGLIEGAVLGLVMGPVVVALGRRFRAAMVEQVRDGRDEVADTQVAEQLQSAIRALNRTLLRGQVPAEAASRRRAYRLAVHYATAFRRFRPFALLIYGLLIVSGLWSARTEQSGWWYALLWLFLLVHTLVWEAWLRRAVRLLRLPGPDGQPEDA